MTLGPGPEAPSSPARIPLQALGGSDRFADVAVIVRVFNEATVVGSVIASLRDAGFPVIAVDDASSDDSAREIDDAGAFRVSHPVNLGAGGALQTGLQAALMFTPAEYVACFDADGQHRVEDLVAMVGKAREGYDVVIGSRFLAGGDTAMPRMKKLLLRAATALMNRRGSVHLTDAHNGLRILRRGVAQQIRLTYTGMAYASELERLLKSGGFRIVEHPVTILYTDYSMAKGQPLLNSVNILVEVAAHRITHWRTQ